jgi:hypothetical protein
LWIALILIIIAGIMGYNVLKEGKKWKDFLCY